MTVHIPFDNSYARLPQSLFSRQAPEVASDPGLIVFNHALAGNLGIDAAGCTDAELAAMFAGNALADGATPIAQAYAGHQFGHWNPGLGDGRAVLLGEVVTADQQRRDIQLKGSGRTPYSRSGDGRAWLGPVLREYLISEAMHALDVPTTRSLAAVTTGDDILRDQGYLPGAVLTRIAASHIRVGTFQLAAARGDVEPLMALYEHTRARHFPDATSPAELLEAMLRRQAYLIAKWAGLGFIHGVMNTDNMTISGETIDYGPCAYMDTYHPDTVFSSIDRQGRYAYSNQPRIAVWNIAQFATALIPLMPDAEAAVEEFTRIVNLFPEVYEAEWLAVLSAKLGLSPTPEARQIAEQFLDMLATTSSDFTNGFAALSTPSPRDHFVDREVYDAWAKDWMALTPDMDLVARSNPQIIPRTHRIEQAIAAAVSGDFKPFHAMLAAVTAPFDTLDEERAFFAQPPEEAEKVRQTFCGT